MCFLLGELGAMFPPGLLSIYRHLAMFQVLIPAVLRTNEKFGYNSQATPISNGVVPPSAPPPKPASAFGRPHGPAAIHSPARRWRIRTTMQSSLVRNPVSWTIWVLMCLGGLQCAFAQIDAKAVAPSEDETELTFERDIWPIFRAHCFDCHGATDAIEGGLDLRQVRRMVQGGESGPAITPGAPQSSYLLDRMVSGEMPPGEHRVSEPEIGVVRRWLSQGAKTAREEADVIPSGLGVTAEERAYWAFQAIQANANPADLDHHGSNPIDVHLRQAMPSGFRFSPEASRRVLIRRLYHDLWGLPPSIEDMDRWAADEAPDWFSRLVDQLLDSPRYGERWGRHWLDIAGYADSEGYTTADAERAWAWKYRDYVIRSFNDDKPLDQFIIEQLAGDELAGPRDGDLTPQQVELLTATGFLRMAADGTGSGADNPAARNQVIGDTLRIVTTSFLGMSVAWRSVMTIATIRFHKQIIIRCEPFSSPLWTGLAGSRQEPAWSRCTPKPIASKPPQSSRKLALSRKKKPQDSPSS